MSNCEHRFVLYSSHTIFSIQGLCIILVNKTLRLLFVVTSSYAVRQRAMAEAGGLGGAQGSWLAPAVPSTAFGGEPATIVCSLLIRAF